MSDAFDTAPHTTQLLNLYLRLTLASYRYNRYFPHSQPTASTRHNRYLPCKSCVRRDTRELHAMNAPRHGAHKIL